jgi:AcrR family transcriptional regulator
MARPRSALSRTDWITAGQDLMRAGGITEVKLRALVANLGVTSGSFYHHFVDFQGYLDALADDYGERHLEATVAAIEAVPSGQRLHMMREMGDAVAAPELDRAMRVWATSNARAAHAVERLDHALLGLILEDLLTLGFDPEEARLRAMVIFAAGIGEALIYRPWPAPSDERAKALELLLRLPD